MKLSREKGKDRRIATREELERALDDLGASADGFAILERDDGAFAQAAGTRAAGFVFEVREGGVHLQSTRADLPMDEVLALFGAWLEGDPRWRTATGWAVYDRDGGVEPAAAPEAPRTAMVRESRSIWSRLFGR